MKPSDLNTIELQNLGNSDSTVHKLLSLKLRFVILTAHAGNQDE